MDAQEIAGTVDEVQEMQTNLYYAIELDTEAQHVLDDAKAQAIIDGTIGGKNAEEREAKAAQVLVEHIGAQRVTAAKVRHAKMMYDRAVMNWDRVKYTIRLLETQKAQA